MEKQIVKYAPCYVYDQKVIVDQIGMLKEAFAGFVLLYSVKANPNIHVMQTIKEAGLGTDAASANEVELSSKLGLTKDKVYYSCPGKTEDDIERVIQKSIIIADSFHDLFVINEVAKRRGQLVEIGLRINPNFTMISDSGAPSKFGIDEEQVFLKAKEIGDLTHVVIKGIHVHIQSQILDYSMLSRYYEKVFALATRLKEELNMGIEFINFGSGVGIVYDDKNDTPLDFVALSKNISKLVMKYNQKLKATLILETGRFVVGLAGKYVTQIVDIKRSRGKTFYIVKNSLNGFIRPSIACLVKKYASNIELLPTEPLFTSEHAFQFEVVNDSVEMERVDIVGHLCTAADVMTVDVMARKAEIGDMLVVSNAGSYAFTLSPNSFSSQDAPVELFLKTDGTLMER